MNVLELKKQIQTFLLTCCDNVYYERADNISSFPYVVFNLTDSFGVEGNREDFTLEIDVWDNTQNTLTLETIVGNIDGDGDLFDATGLHRRLITSLDLFSAKIYRDRRINITDTDERIRRRHLKYDIQCYLV